MSSTVESPPPNAPHAVASGSTMCPVVVISLVPEPEVWIVPYGIKLITMDLRTLTAQVTAGSTGRLPALEHRTLQL
jgi:hypothetical protein